MGAVTVPFLPDKGVLLRAPDGHCYSLRARLGGGRYSEIWQADMLDHPEEEVVVKMMAGGLKVEERKVFIQEAYTLKMLALELQRLAPGAESLVPAVYSISDQHDPPFFVETLARGKPLDLILRQDGSMRETEALILGKQLCLVLQALHEGVQRTCLDFQPQHIFWERDSLRITVVDWNLLGAYTAADVARDLENVARLLYRLMAGESYSPDRRKEPARWQDIVTAGSKEVLKQALHPNLFRRFPDAAALRSALERLIAWWEMDVESLLVEAGWQLQQTGNLPLAERESALRAARAILDIARNRGAAATQVIPMEEQVQAGLRRSGCLQQGESAYRAGDDEQAAAFFAEARAQAITSSEQLALCRWEVVLQDKGADRGEVAWWLEQLAAWTDAWIEGRAAEIALPKEILSRGLPSSVQVEIAAWQALRQAHESDLGTVAGVGEAVRCYRQAMEMAGTLPYGELLLQIWGDLATRTASLEESFQRLNREQMWRTELMEEFGESEARGVRALSKALRESPGEEFLTRLALEWAERLWEKGECDLAEDLLNNVVLEAFVPLLGEVLSLRRRIVESGYWHKWLGRAEIMLDALQGDQEADPAAWEKIFWTLQAIVSRGLTPSVQRRAWRVFQGVLLSPNFPPVWEEPFLKLAAGLALDPQAIVELEEQRRALKEARRVEDLRRQIVSHQHLAREQAGRGSEFGYEQALQLLSKAMEWAQEIQDGGIVEELNAEAERYAVSLRGLQRDRQVALIQSYRQEAERLFRSGLLAQFDPALENLDRAISLAENLGDGYLLDALKAQRQEYAGRRGWFHEQWRSIERLGQEGNWAEGISLLQKIKESGITGWDAVGQTRIWLDHFRFNQAVAAFQVAYRCWQVVNDNDLGQREVLLEEMSQSLQEMYRLLPCLGKQSVQQRNMLRTLKAQYEECRRKRLSGTRRAE